MRSTGRHAANESNAPMVVTSKPASDLTREVSLDWRDRELTPADTPEMVTVPVVTESENCKTEGLTSQFPELPESVKDTGLPGTPERATVTVMEPVAPTVSCVLSVVTVRSRPSESDNTQV